MTNYIVIVRTGPVCRNNQVTFRCSAGSLDHAVALAKAAHPVIWIGRDKFIASTYIPMAIR